MTISNQADFLTQTMYRHNSHKHTTASISTNSELITSVLTGDSNPNHVHLLTADTQSGGRGQSGRSWQSPKGNVYLSLYYPTAHAELPLTKPISGLLSLCVGYFLAQLPIIQTINEQRHSQQETQKIGVKWANDIGFYDNQCLFRKLSGILIEPVVNNGKMLGVVVGVGLNVLTPPTLTKQTQEGMSYQSVSLADLYPEKELAVHDLYQPMSHAIFQAILTHQSISANETKLQTFLTDFSKSDILQGRQLKVIQTSQTLNGKGSNKDIVQLGKVVGIDKFGCLRLQEQDGKVKSLFTGKIEVVE